MKFAMMIIWFGAGKYAQFDTQRFQDVSECQAAKAAIVQHYAETWSPISADDIACIPVGQRP